MANIWQIRGTMPYGLLLSRNKRKRNIYHTWLCFANENTGSRLTRALTLIDCASTCDCSCVTSKNEAFKYRREMEILHVENYTEKAV